MGASTSQPSVVTILVVVSDIGVISGIGVFDEGEGDGGDVVNGFNGFDPPTKAGLVSITDPVCLDNLWTMYRTGRTMAEAARQIIAMV